MKVQEPGALMSEGRRKWISQFKRKKKEKSLYLCLFVPCGSLIY
jgi:hypothetical protein